MKRAILCVGLVLIAAVSNGCITTYLSAKASQREIATERIVASRDKAANDALTMGVPPETAIRAIKMEGGVGIGVDLFDWETLTKHPVRQLGAAALDAALLYGAYSLTQSGNDNTSKNVTYNISTYNSDDTTVTINQNDTTTTTTTTDNHSGDGNNR